MSHSVAEDNHDEMFDVPEECNLAHTNIWNLSWKKHRYNLRL